MMLLSNFHWGWLWLWSLCGMVSTEPPGHAPPLLSEANGKTISWSSSLDTISLELYPFLNLEADTLLHAPALLPFFEKLDQLERGERRRLSIVHIGDSHIQADWWTGYLRTRLQERFGSGGRGLVFPYALAETNSPTDIRSGSNQSWEYRRSTFRRQHLPIGIAGMSLQTSGKQIWIDLQIRNDSLISYAFDRVKLFGQSPGEPLEWNIGQFATEESIALASPPKVYHKVRTGDTLYGLALRYGTRVSRLQQWNNLRGSMIRPGQELVVGNGHSSVGSYDQATFHAQRPFQWEQGPQRGQPTTIQLDSLTRRLLLRGRSTTAADGQVRLFGMSLENSRQAGLLYHAIGVNGVTFFHYHQASEFWRQLPHLEPDLIIVSLGTNEAAMSGFEAAAFSEQVQRFIDQLAGLPERPAALFTTPPDARRRRRYDNPSIRLAGDIIIERAHANGYAAWDLQEVMGGESSVQQWKSQNLVARDYLHFTRTGYMLQGELLYQAIKRAYGGS